MEKVAQRGAIGSAVVGLIGILFLLAFYATFINALGTVNDLCIAAQYMLMLPLPVTLHRLSGANSPVSAAAAVVGTAAMLAVIVLDYVFLAGWLTFEQQVVPISIAMLIGGIWLVIASLQFRVTTSLGRELAVSIPAALYLGYPLWAFLLWRRLRHAGLGNAGTIRSRGR